MTTPKLQTFEKDQSKINFTINRISSNFDTITGGLTDSSGAFTPAAPLDALAYNGMQINGSMDVSQELGLSPQTVNNKYIVDGFLFNFNGSVVPYAAQFADGPPGLFNCIRIAITTAEASLGANDFTLVRQFIEGYRASRLAFGIANAQSVSIGFWSKIHRPGMYSGALRNAASTRSYVFTFAQAVADTWQYNTVTIPGDVTGTWVGASNTTSFDLMFTMAAGSSLTTAPNVWTAGNFIGAIGTTNGVAATSDVFQITGVVVLAGNETPSASRSALIMRPFTEELVTCQRYYQKYAQNLISGNGAAGATVYYDFDILPMRSSPAVSFATTAYSNASALATNAAMPNHVRLAIVISASGYGYATSDVIYDARL